MVTLPSAISSTIPFQESLKEKSPGWLSIRRFTQFEGHTDDTVTYRIEDTGQYFGCLYQTRPTFVKESVEMMARNTRNLSQ
jgi:hypothetical protein